MGSVRQQQQVTINWLNQPSSTNGPVTQSSLMMNKDERKIIPGEPRFATNSKTEQNTSQ